MDKEINHNNRYFKRAAKVAILAFGVLLLPIALYVFATAGGLGLSLLRDFRLNVFNDVVFTLDFPIDADLGELWIVEDVNCFTCGTGQEYLGRATGSYRVRLPASHWFVSLRMTEDASQLMPHLASSKSLQNIGDINLAGSDVTDADLRHLEGINLRSLNLGKTDITGEGLQYLQPHKKWFFIDLLGCENLDLNYLAHFRGWKRSTITVASGYKWGEEHTEQELNTLERAGQIICDGKSENVCGVQIR